MTDLLTGLVVVALLVLAGVFIRELRPHTREAAQLDLELDENSGGPADAAKMRDLQAADLVGADDSGSSAAAGVVAAAARRCEGDAAGPSGVPDADRQGPDGVAVTAQLTPDDAADFYEDDETPDEIRRAWDAGEPVLVIGMTPKQRKRARKKGRIPRNLPGPNVLAGGLHDRAGEPDLAGQAEDTGRLPGEYHHPRHERIPRPLTIWDPMMARPMPIFPTLLESVAHEAHFRRWEAEMAGLINGAREWLETAA